MIYDFFSEESRAFINLVMSSNNCVTNDMTIKFYRQSQGHSSIIMFNNCLTNDMTSYRCLTSFISYVMFNNCLTNDMTSFLVESRAFAMSSNCLTSDMTSLGELRAFINYVMSKNCLTNDMTFYQWLRAVINLDMIT